MKILVRGANWIGDAVMTIPALRALRSLYPQANITLYTKPWALGVFQEFDQIDRILTIENEGSGLRDTIRESRRVAQGKYDLALLFTNSFRSAAVVRLAGIKQRIGYSREGRGILLTDPIKPPSWQNERHQVFYYLKLIEELAKRTDSAISFDAIPSDRQLAVSESRRVKARKTLVEAGLDSAKPTIGFGVGSTNSTAKRWGEEKFASLADLIVSSGANVLLLGAKEEVEISARVAALANSDIIDLTGNTDLAAASAILAEIDLFASNDMGLAHLAATVGTKTLVIFGPTNEVVTRPFAPNASVVREEVECSPCMLRTCPIDHRCMTRISPDTVYAKILGMLNEKRA